MPILRVFSSCPSWPGHRASWLQHPVVLSCVPHLTASLLLLLHANDSQQLFESCQPPFPLPCLYWITFTILLTAVTSQTVWIHSQVKWNESSLWGLLLQRGRSFSSWLLRVATVSPAVPAQLHLPAHGVGGSLTQEQKGNLILIGILEKNTWWEREGCVLTVVGAVSAGSGTFMEGEGDTEANIN